MTEAKVSVDFTDNVVWTEADHRAARAMVARSLADTSSAGYRPLGRTELIKRVSDVSGLTQTEAQAALDAALYTITNAVRSGEMVRITGFGTFKARDLGPRRGRNPQTGAPVRIKASKGIGFSASAGLKADLNARSTSRNRVAGKPLQVSRAEVTAVEEKLRDIKSRLVPQDEPLLFPLIPCLREAGQVIPADLQQLSIDREIYLLNYGADLRIARNEHVVSASLKLRYQDVDGDRVLTHSMFPGPEFDERLIANVSVKVGVTAGGEFEVNPAIASVVPGLTFGAGVTAAVNSSVLFFWKYQVVKAVVNTYGIRSQYAEWSFLAREKLRTFIDVRAVLLVPRKIEWLTIFVSGDIRVKPNRFPLWRGTTRVLEEIERKAHVIPLHASKT